MRSQYTEMFIEEIECPALYIIECIGCPFRFRCQKHLIYLILALKSSKNEV